MAEEQQVQQGPQRVTMKDPKKVEADRCLAAHNCKKREAKKREETSTIREERSEPILRCWSCYSCWSDRRPWLSHLSNKAKTSHH